MVVEMLQQHADLLRRDRFLCARARRATGAGRPAPRRRGCRFPLRVDALTETGLAELLAFVRSVAAFVRLHRAGGSAASGADGAKQANGGGQHGHFILPGQRAASGARGTWESRGADNRHTAHLRVDARHFVHEQAELAQQHWSVGYFDRRLRGCCCCGSDRRCGVGAHRGNAGTRRRCESVCLSTGSYLRHQRRHG